MGNDGVLAVEKALVLLDCFAPGVESLSLAALARMSGIHKTTVYRLMNSLERMGYVVRSMAGTYSLGSRLLYLGAAYEQSFHSSMLVNSTLLALVAATTESASFYVFDGGRRLCLFRKEPLEGLRDTQLAGTSLPLDDTAIGRVLRYWGRGELLYTSTPALPLFTSRTREGHTAALATPVFGHGNKFMGALTLSGAASRFEDACANRELGHLQVDAAYDLSHKLGATIPFCAMLYRAKMPAAIGSAHLRHE